MMNRRLELIANMVSDGRGLIDVGTDHAYLPAALAERGYTGRLIASDINAAPLENARKTAREAIMEARIEFLLCDGLVLCPPEAVDTIVVAGMGGEAICGILDRADWCMDASYTLLLQPMTKAEVLRYWLVNNGFVLCEEKLVRDGAFIYQVIKARYERNMRLRDAELFSGAFVNIRGEALCAEWLDGWIERFGKEERGLLLSAKRNEGRLSICRRIQEDLSEMRGMLK